MLRPIQFSCLFLLPLILSGCGGGDDTYTLIVSNELTMNRQESLEIPKSEFGNILCEHFARFVVRDAASRELLPVQLVDEDMDGERDYLLFQPHVLAGETRRFEIFPGAEGIPDPDPDPDPENRTFSRFVPERTDDYAWENDRVAFRTFGPAAQRMVEENVPGGTFSTGIDCWLKRVEYPIIDKWYWKSLEGGGSYHEDTGEGIDNFHVGSSRGCGGTGVWDAGEQVLYTSKNFTSWTTVAAGPLRTRFELDYAPWEYPGGMLNEQKIISLDLGSNLMRIEIRFVPGKTPETISAGITLHEKDGSILVDESAGWFSYWKPHGDSELGMGIVVEPQYLAGHTEHLEEEKDRSHLFVHMKPFDNIVVYYVGFGWLKSGQFNNQKEWVAYLEEFAQRLGSGLKYEVSK